MILGSYSGNVEFHANGSERLRIDSSGRLGIGTSSPATSLHIANAGNSFLTLERTGTTGGTGTFAINMEGGSSQQTTMAYDDGGKLVIGRSSDPATQAGFSNDFVLDSSGRLGIGTTSPVGKLSISDSGATGVEFSPDDSNARVQQLYYDRVDNAYRTSLLDAGDYQFRISGTERMRIDSSGRVGIGCTPTSFATEIQATSGGNALKLRGRSAAENAGWLAWTDNADNVEAAMYATANNLIFTNTASYTERMRINSSGQVGIACTDQSNLLTVDANSASSTTDSISVRNRGVSSANHTTGLRFQFSSAVPSAIRSRLTNTSNGAGTLSFYTSSDGSAVNLTERMSISNAGVISADGVYSNTTSDAANVRVLSNGNIIRSTSSKKYKNSITDASKGLKELNNLRPVTYKGNEDGDTVFMD